VNGTHSSHPAEDRLKIFMRGGGLPQEEKQAIVRHLLTRCERCLEVTRKLWDFGEFPADLAEMAAELMAPFRCRTVLEDWPGAS
jgi:hypothetical protein